jgi:hypothetical protein
MSGDLRQNLENMDNKLLSEFSRRVLDGDSTAGFDLAQFFWTQLPSSDTNLHLVIIEALIIQSAELGSSDARTYLDEMWPKMKEVLRGRLVRRGFKDG